MVVKEILAIVDMAVDNLATVVLKDADKVRDGVIAGAPRRRLGFGIRLCRLDCRVFYVNPSGAYLYVLYVIFNLIDFVDNNGIDRS